MSSPQSLEQAKAALKRSLIDALISSKKNTDKTVALLKSSAQYQDYLVQAASAHLEYFKSVGGSTSDQRKASENSARRDADALLTGPNLDELKERVEQAMDTLEHLKAGLAEKIRSGKAAVTAIDQIMKYEFMRDITSSKGLVIDFKSALVSSSIKDLEKRLTKATELHGEMAGVMRGDDEAKVRDALRKFREKLESARVDIKSATKDFNSALSKTSVTIDEKALEALISQKVAKKELEKLTEAKEWVDRIKTVLGAFAETNSVTGTVSKAAGLINTVAFAAGRDTLIDKRGKEYEAENTRGQVYAEHDKDPLMLARNLVERQKIALEILMRSLDTTISGAMIATMGHGEAVVHAWNPISKTITAVVRSHLDARIKLASDAVAAKNAALALQYETDENKAFEDTIKNSILEVLTEGTAKFVESARESATASSEGGESSGIGAGVLEGIQEHPGDFAAMIIAVILPPLMSQIWKIFPPKPAQQVSGADLTAMQDVTFQAQFPSFAVGSGPGRGTPKGPVTEIAAQPADLDSAIWDKFAATNAGRTQNPNDPATRVYHVAYDVPAFGGVRVWGSFDPRSNRFTPEQLDDSDLEDWSARMITGTGYTDGTDVVTGSWEMVQVGSWNYVRLVDTGDASHWGSRGANTSGPRGVKSQLGSIVEGLRPRQQNMEPFVIR
jgi:hypothetical protein